MKFLLIGFKLSIGIEQYMISFKKGLEANAANVEICGDKKPISKYGGYGISNSGSPAKMFLDTLNPLIWYRFAIYLKQKSPDYSIFVASHPLNFICILITKIISNSKIISVIHDPMPHSGEKFKFIILISQYLQIKLSHKVLVAGKKLKEETSKLYSINKDNIIVMYIGNNRNEISEFVEKHNRKYFSLLGRIEDYKGVDIFLKAAKKVLDLNYTNIEFFIAGAGNIKKYIDQINEIDKSKLTIRNELISDKDFDNIIKESYAIVLPYKDATQTGTIQIANSLSTPCIATNVGSLPELIIKNETGIVINPNSINELVDSMIFLAKNNSKLYEMEKNCHKHFLDKLNWISIVKSFIEKLDYN